MSKSKPMKVGDIFNTLNSGDCEVINVLDKKAIVKFCDGVEVLACKSSIRCGEVWNKNVPGVVGVGILGYGDFSFTEHKVAYNKWVGALVRSSSEDFKLKNTAYKDCSISADWLNFQKFARDYYAMHGSSNKNWQLDKDVLVKDNKHYSNSTCCLLPQEINCITVRRAKLLGDLPQGVEGHGNKFIVRAKQGDKRVVLLSTYSLEDAYNCSSENRTNRIRNLALKYKKDLCPKVFESLINYEVDEFNFQDYYNFKQNGGEI